MSTASTYITHTVQNHLKACNDFEALKAYALQFDCSLEEAIKVVETVGKVVR